MPRGKHHKELTLIRVRRKALLLAMDILDASTDSQTLTEAGEWLDQSAITTNVRLVTEAMCNLKALAERSNIPTTV